MSSAEAHPRPHPALLAGICVVLAAPFLLVRDPPLFDLPVHLARQHILYDPAIAEAASRHYQVLWRVLPNLALDLWVGAFRWIVPIDWAVRLFLAATAVQLFLGTVALNRALFGSRARGGLLGALFAVGGIFMIGLVNLCFGIGLCLWVFALTIRLKRAWVRFAVCGSLGVLVLLAHLYAFALYGLLLGAYALGRALDSRDGPAARVRAMAGLLLPLVPGIAFYLLLVPRGIDHFLPMTWYLSMKLQAVLTLFGIYSPRFGMACLLLAAGGAVLLRPGLVFAPSMRLPVAALILLFVLLPFENGYASLVDTRVPPVLALVLSASIDWRPGAAARRVGEAAALGLFGVWAAVTITQWLSWQPVYDEARQAVALIEPGARLLPLGADDFALPSRDHNTLHVDAYAVALRGAFIPDMLADRPSELLHYVPADEPAHAAFPKDAALADYDYVLLFHPDAAALPPGTEPLFSGRDFVLAKIVSRPVSH